MEIDNIKPGDIEKQSFEIIGRELGDFYLEPEKEPVIKRVIHTTADFDYADNLVFSPNAISIALDVIKQGTAIVTDTNMAKAGINKKALNKLNASVLCFISDSDVQREAEKSGITRAAASMDKAGNLEGNLIFAIGNAPTALIRLYELIRQNKIRPALVIGVPVGFVNVIEAKNLIMDSNVPYIAAKGRKGGSNVAAAICNALLYMAGGR